MKLDSRWGHKWFWRAIMGASLIFLSTVSIANGTLGFDVSIGTAKAIDLGKTPSVTTPDNKYQVWLTSDLYMCVAGIKPTTDKPIPLTLLGVFRLEECPSDLLIHSASQAKDRCIVMVVIRYDNGDQVMVRIEENGTKHVDPIQVHPAVPSKEYY